MSTAQYEVPHGRNCPPRVRAVGGARLPSGDGSEDWEAADRRAHRAAAATAPPAGCRSWWGRMRQTIRRPRQLTSPRSLQVIVLLRDRPHCESASTDLDLSGGGNAAA